MCGVIRYARVLSDTIAVQCVCPIAHRSADRAMRGVSRASLSWLLSVTMCVSVLIESGRVMTCSVFMFSLLVVVARLPSRRAVTGGRLVAEWPTHAGVIAGQVANNAIENLAR